MAFTAVTPQQPDTATTTAATREAVQEPAKQPEKSGCQGKPIALNIIIDFSGFLWALIALAVLSFLIRKIAGQ